METDSLVGVDATLAHGDLEKEDDDAIRSTTEERGRSGGFRPRSNLSKGGLSSLPSVSLGGGPPTYPTPSPTSTTPPPVSNPTPLPVSNPMPAPVSNPIPTGKTLAPAPIATLNHPGAASNPPPSISPRRVHTASGVVVKSPRFYSAYTGPKLAELNAVKASEAPGERGFPLHRDQSRPDHDGAGRLSGASTATATCPPARSRDVRTSSSTRS